MIKNFIISASYFEVMDYKKQGKKPVIEEYEKNQWSYIVEVMLITVKSLIPSVHNEGNIIDYKRFTAELNLWKSYRHGQNKSLINATDKCYDENYWSLVDETIYARVAIITLSNQNWETIKSEVIKNVLYTCGNIEILLECILLSKLLFLKLENKNYEYKDILDELKQETINLSQIELNRYEKLYNMPKSTYEKNYTIQFERVKIELISFLNEVYLDNKFDILKQSLGILKQNDEFLDKSQSFFTCGLVGIVTGKIPSRDIKDVDFLENLCSYISKLRKGRINPESLQLESYNVVDIFKYNVKDVFEHGLLNKCQVLYKGEKDKFIISYIKTRTGTYRFVKLKS